MHQFQSFRCQSAGCNVSQLQCVGQVGCCGFGVAVEVVPHRLRNDEVGFKAHFLLGGLGVLREDGPDVTRLSLRVPNPGCGLDDGEFSEVAQKLDGIEQVGFARPVGTRDAGKGAKSHLCIHDVFKALDSESGQHRVISIYLTKKRFLLFLKAEEAIVFDFNDSP